MSPIRRIRSRRILLRSSKTIKKEPLEAEEEVQ